MYVCMYVCVYIYIYIYVYSERQRDNTVRRIYSAPRRAAQARGPWAVVAQDEVVNPVTMIDITHTHIQEHEHLHGTHFYDEFDCVKVVPRQCVEQPEVPSVRRETDCAVVCCRLLRSSNAATLPHCLEILVLSQAQINTYII